MHDELFYKNLLAVKVVNRRSCLGLNDQHLNKVLTDLECNKKKHVLQDVQKDDTQKYDCFNFNCLSSYRKKNKNKNTQNLELTQQNFANIQKWGPNRKSPSNQINCSSPQRCMSRQFRRWWCQHQMCQCHCSQSCQIIISLTLHTKRKTIKQLGSN